MSLESSISRAIHIGNGLAVSFPFAFKVWTTDQIKVLVGDGSGAERDMSADVDVVLSATGGTVTFDTAPERGMRIAIVRNMPFLQPDRYITGTRFDPHEIEGGLDVACAERQELRSSLERAFKLPETANVTADELVQNLFQAGLDAQDAAADAALAADMAQDAAQDAERSAVNAEISALKSVEAKESSLLARDGAQDAAREAGAHAAAACAAADSVSRERGIDPNASFVFPLFDQPGKAGLRRVTIREDGGIVESLDENGAKAEESGENISLFLQPGGAYAAAVVTEDDRILLASDALGMSVNVCGKMLGSSGGGSAGGGGGSSAAGAAVNILHVESSDVHRADTGVLRIFVMYGQSLSVGSRGFPLVTTREELDAQGVPSGRVLMLGNDANRADERADNGNGGLDVRLGLSGAVGQVFRQETATCLVDLLAKEDQISSASSPRLYTWTGRDGTTQSGTFLHYGQTPAESLGYALAALEGWKGRSLWIAPGRGGTAYEGLKKGTDRYSNTLEAVRAAVRLAQQDGERAEVAAIVLKHGEADATGSPEFYRECLEEWTRDFNADLKEITGQEASIPLFIGMPSSMTEGRWGAVEGMLKADQANDLIHVVSADYCNDYYRDFNHLTGIGYHRLGERMADPIARTLAGDEAPCFAMTSAVRSGRYVDIAYAVPRPPLHLDFSTVSERSGTCAGFQFFTAQGIDSAIEADTLGRAVEPEEIRIVAVTVLQGGERIRLELERDPEGAPIELLSYAWKGHGNTEDDSGELTEGDGGAIRRYAATIPRGNVRDSAGDSLRSSWDGGRLDNWAIHQIIQIQTEAGE